MLDSGDARVLDLKHELTVRDATRPVNVQPGQGRGAVSVEANVVLAVAKQLVRLPTNLHFEKVVPP